MKYGEMGSTVAMAILFLVQHCWTKEIPLPILQAVISSMATCAAHQVRPEAHAVVLCLRHSSIFHRFWKRHLL